MLYDDVKEIRWFKGRKLIDVWKFDKIDTDDPVYACAITPIWYTDKHGNMWLNGINKCDLIVTSNTVKEIKKDYNKAREILDLKDNNLPHHNQIL